MEGGPSSGETARPRRDWIIRNRGALQQTTRWRRQSSHFLDQAPPPCDRFRCGSGHKARGEPTLPDRRVARVESCFRIQCHRSGVVNAQQVSAGALVGSEVEITRSGRSIVAIASIDGQEGKIATRKPVPSESLMTTMMAVTATMKI
jgi:hypothetical protein